MYGPVLDMERVVAKRRDGVHDPDAPTLVKIKNPGIARWSGGASGSTESALGEISRHPEKLFQEFLVPEPVAEALDPIVGGLVVFGHAETMTTGSVGVQLGGLVGGFPGQEERGA